MAVEPRPVSQILDDAEWFVAISRAEPEAALRLAESHIKLAVSLIEEMSMVLRREADNQVSPVGEEAAPRC